jgi:hypothetical protein
MRLCSGADRVKIGDACDFGLMGEKSGPQCRQVRKVWLLASFTCSRRHRVICLMLEKALTASEDRLPPDRTLLTTPAPDPCDRPGDPQSSFLPEWSAAAGSGWRTPDSLTTATF